jgi:hypothetical protein
MTIERRALAAELRAKGRRLEGYAAVYGVPAEIRDYTETIAAGDEPPNPPGRWRNACPDA